MRGEETGLPHVACYLDEIITTGKTQQERLDYLYADYAKRVRQESVEYLGLKIEAQSLHANYIQKIEAPALTNEQEVRALMELVNYYGRFISNQVLLSQPSISKGHTKKWTQKCSQELQSTKTTLVSSNFLTYYNSKLQNKQAEDASSFCVRVVISHIMEMERSN